MLDRSAADFEHANAQRRLVVIATSILCWVSLIPDHWAVGAEPSAADGRELPARSDPQWDAAFTRSAGWTGADVIGTVDLQDGRTVWLFGDSWIGKVAAGVHTPGSRLVNNSIAVHRSSPNDRAGPPADQDLKFYWGPNDSDGHPTAWIVPDAANVQSEREIGEEHDAAAGWFWTTGGGLFLPGEDGAARLVMFLFHVGRRNAENSVWNFENIGGAMAVVDNPHDAVEKWRVRQLPIPHAIAAKQARNDRDLRPTSWGMAAFVDRVSDAREPQFVYIYGVREASPLNKQAVLARVPSAQIEQFRSWRFYTGGEEWSSKQSDAVAVCERLVSEFSVERYQLDDRARFVMVHSEPVFGTRIFVRTAPRPQGPWSQPVPIFDVPDVRRHRSFFTYAAKGHLHLSRPGELLVSYVVNAHEFRSMINDAFIYRPRFVTAPLRALRPGD